MTYELILLAETRWRARVTARLAILMKLSRAVLYEDNSVRSYHLCCASAIIMQLTVPFRYRENSRIMAAFISLQLRHGQSHGSRVHVASS
jgi:hypothetical protein